MMTCYTAILLLLLLTPSNIQAFVLPSSRPTAVHEATKAWTRSAAFITEGAGAAAHRMEESTTTPTGSFAASVAAVSSFPQDNEEHQQRERDLTRMMMKLQQDNAAAVVSLPIPLPFPATSPTAKSSSNNIWMRRLNTREDSKGIHKISSITSCFCSLVIVTSMLSTGLQEFPTWLAPVDALFVASNAAMCATTVDMCQRFRRQGDAIAQTHLSAGLHTFIMSLYASWQAPYGSVPFMDEVFPVSVSVLVFMAALVDFEIFGHHDEKIVPVMHNKYGLSDQGMWQAAMRSVTYGAALLVPTMINLTFLAYIWSEMAHGHDRTAMQAAMESGYGIPGLTGNSMPYLYMANVAIACLVSLQSFVGTLCHKRLIAADDAASFVGVANTVITALSIMGIYSPSFFLAQ